jgi:hypothetical protein
MKASSQASLGYIVRLMELKKLRVCSHYQSISIRVASGQSSKL